MRWISENIVQRTFVRLTIFSSLLNRSCPLIGYLLASLENLSMSLALWVPSHSSRLV